MFTFGFNVKPRKTGGVSYDADAAAFFTAASITDTTQKSAVNQLVLDLKSYNIWTKMKAIYPVVGGSASSHAVNLKTPGTYNLSFATGWTHASTGMTPNGTSAYADTSFITNLLTANSNHLGLYVRTNQAANAVPIGSYTNTPTNKLFQLNISTGTGTYYYSGDTTTEVTTSIADSKGFFVGTRTAINNRKIFRNGSSIASQTTSVSTDYNNISNFIGARNFNGTANTYTSQQIAFSSIGDGLTDAEAANFYTAVQAYQTTLGRSIGTQTVSDSDAQTFINSASITDQVEANAINDLVIGLKADSLWTKMRAIYPVVGGSAGSHAVNLKTPGTYNLTFATGMTHSSTGMVSNGTTGYADTNILPTSVLSLNSVHLTFYSRTNSTGNYAEIGASGTGVTNTTYLQIDSKWSDNNFYGNANDADFTTNTVADSLGFFAVSRTGASASKTYKNGSVVTTKNVSSVALPDRNIFICARNLANGGTSNYSNRQCAFASIGDGLTDTEAANLYTRVQNFQTTLNRQV